MAARPIIRLTHVRFCHAAANAGPHFGGASVGSKAGALMVSYLNSSTARSVEMMEKFRLSLSTVLQSMRREQEIMESKKLEDQVIDDSPITQSNVNTSTVEAESESPEKVQEPSPIFNSQRWLLERERHHLEKRLFMGIDLSSDDFPEPTSIPTKAESGRWKLIAGQLVQQATCAVVASKERLSNIRWTKSATAVEESVESPALPGLSHVTKEGKAQMVDVGRKSITHRAAMAEGSVKVGQQIMKLLRENQLKKGDALTIAQVAGVMAAKRTSDLIPLCHNIVLNDIQVQLRLDEVQNIVEIRSAVRCDGRTGAEMEALTAVTVAALTVYDMCKAVSKEMVIGDVRLVSKTGGKSDYGVSAVMMEE